MIKLISQSFAVFLVVLISCAKPVQKSINYREAVDPNANKLANWTSVPEGLQASFVSPFIRYPKSSIPDVEAKNAAILAGWKGERVYTQLLLWSADSVENIGFEFSELASTSGKKMPATVAKAQFVRYVLTDEFGGGCDKRKPEDFSVSLSPDVLDNSPTFTKSPKTCCPVWITVEIPENAEAGKYQANLTVKAKNRADKEFQIIIEVIDKNLPKPADWKFYLDLWQNPYSVARVHQVKVWSKEHWDLLRPLMKMLADAGQKPLRHQSTTNRGERKLKIRMKA